MFPPRKVAPVRTDPDLFTSAAVVERPPQVAELMAHPIFCVEAPSVAKVTSELAADFQNRFGRANYIRLVALRYINGRKQGYTDAELQDVLQFADSNSVRPRRWDLEGQRLIRCDEPGARTYRDSRGVNHLLANPYVATVKADLVLRGLLPWPLAWKRLPPE